jgi:hypothetical protein
MTPTSEKRFDECLVGVSSFRLMLWGSQSGSFSSYAQGIYFGEATVASC